MYISESHTVGSTVAVDYRTASVFQKHGIDFCCKGGQTIDDACLKLKLDKVAILTELNQLLTVEDLQSDEFNKWPMGKLIDYIIDTHHAYVVEKMPIILQFLEKLCKVHGQRHPELFEIYNEFNAMSHELHHHLKKEELVVFPYIINMENAISKGEKVSKPVFGTIENPINMMMYEHNIEGDRFLIIEQLTNRYTAPDDGCTTYRVAFKMLQEFEEDLHKHIHLENNILFPKAIIEERECFNNIILAN